MTEITRLQELFYEVKVEEVMTRDVITVSPQTSMSEFREILRDRSISGTPVVENGQLVGIISIEDLIESLARGEMDALVGGKMTRDPITIPAQESVVVAVSHFSRYGFGRFPIADRDGNLVGILTRGDIIQGLLKKLELEYHEEEVRRYRASHIFEDLISDLTSITLRYDVPALDFDKGGEASSRIKRALKRLGIGPQIARRVAISTYELEMNIIIHTEAGGEIMAEIQPGKIIIRAVDTGPGIPDIEKAMEPGFSTAPAWIREMGFGAGMGLLNVKRCADEMLIESPNNLWTSVKIVIYLDQNRPPGES